METIKGSANRLFQAKTDLIKNTKAKIFEEKYFVKTFDGNIFKFITRKESFLVSLHLNFGGGSVMDNFDLN